jgi:hypothetical protein
MNFLRHFEGAKPGVKRKVVSDPNTKKNEYEKKRKRTFQHSWLKEFPWLTYDEAVGKMYCTNCKLKSNNDNSPFVKGNENFKIDVIKTHASSRLHLKNANVISAEKNPVCQSQAAECLTKLKKAEYDKLVVKFRTVHCLAKCHLSFNLYKTICRLDQSKGLDVGKSYLNDKSAASFMSAIAQVVRQDIVKVLDQSKYFSFTIDGATDFMGDDIENIYIRTCTLGNIKDTFLHIGPSESACSQDIHNHVKGVFEKLGVSNALKDKLVGFTADGASNMQGKLSKSFK